MGACAVDGGLAAALPNLTGATGVLNAFPGLGNLVNLPGRPANVVNLVATIVCLITFNQTLRKWIYSIAHILPTAKRSMMNASVTIFYEQDKFVLAWGDEGHKNGWCLSQDGLQGTRDGFQLSLLERNDGTNWPIGAGHGCIGCTTPNFWEQMTPFYQPVED